MPTLVVIFSTALSLQDSNLVPPPTQRSYQVIYKKEIIAILIIKFFELP